ncbi:hypothetical protein [Sphingobium sp. LB126]|uniref:hypothetical protein n=1 Tax=Sphingobium sp. LB126 TaxID=1983755 RepID=UPI0012FE2F36|nr:hypothetical protein [Sphingobium sp. LB126]
MVDVIFLDTNDLIYAINAGLGNWEPGDPIPPDAYRFLDDLLVGDDRLVTNSKIIEELTAGGYDDGPLIKDWLDQHSNRIDVDILSPEVAAQYTGSDKGERSLAFETAQNPEYQAGDPQKPGNFWRSGLV